MNAVRTKLFATAACLAGGLSLAGCPATDAPADAASSPDAVSLSDAPGGNDAFASDAGGGATCGDDVCDPAAMEDWRRCPVDCAPVSMCGDGICGVGENAAGCPDDCSVLMGCGDGNCDGPEEDAVTCPRDCSSGVCGDGICGRDETPMTCSDDCIGACGNGTCDSGAGENTRNCPFDCGLTGTCGDTVCGFGESPLLCPEDCAQCGDGVCSPVFEDMGSCPIDCAPPEI